MKNYLKRAVKKIYSFCFRPFFKRGVNIRIGTAGTFRFDFYFLFNKFDKFGSGHNAGFQRWLEACRKKDLIFDIGAHIGLYSIPASTLLESGKYIYAFEPSSANRSYLERHIRFNNIGNIKVFSFLVGRESQDMAAFYENRELDGMDSIAIWKNHDSYEKIFKRQVSLDDFCAAESAFPELIKIDVEGGELNVLKGAEALMKRYGPIVFLSVHPKRLAVIKQSVQELKNLIDSLDYAIYDSTGNITKDLDFNEYILIPKEKKFNEVF